MSTKYDKYTFFELYNYLKDMKLKCPLSKSDLINMIQIKKIKVPKKKKTSNIEFTSWLLCVDVKVDDVNEMYTSYETNIVLDMSKFEICNQDVIKIMTNNNEEFHYKIVQIGQKNILEDETDDEQYNIKLLDLETNKVSVISIEQFMTTIDYYDITYEKSTYLTRLHQ